jgi:hypothetical protein
MARAFLSNHSMRWAGSIGAWPNLDMTGLNIGTPLTLAIRYDVIMLTRYSLSTSNKSPTPARTVSMAKGKAAKMTELVGVRFTAEALHAIEEWRRQQPVIPSRTDAIRALVQKGLAASKPESVKAKR